MHPPCHTLQPQAHPAPALAPRSTLGGCRGRGRRRSRRGRLRLFRRLGLLRGRGLLRRGGLLRRRLRARARLRRHHRFPRAAAASALQRRPRPQPLSARVWCPWKKILSDPSTGACDAAWLAQLPAGTRPRGVGRRARLLGRRLLDRGLRRGLGLCGRLRLGRLRLRAAPSVRAGAAAAPSVSPPSRTPAAPRSPAGRGGPGGPPAGRAPSAPGCPAAPHRPPAARARRGRRTFFSALGLAGALACARAQRTGVRTLGPPPRATSRATSALARRTQAARAHLLRLGLHHLRLGRRLGLGRLRGAARPRVKRCEARRCRPGAPARRPRAAPQAAASSGAPWWRWSSSRPPASAARSRARSARGHGMPRLRTGTGRRQRARTHLRLGRLRLGCPGLLLAGRLRAAGRAVRPLPGHLTTAAAGAGGERPPARGAGHSKGRPRVGRAQGPTLPRASPEPRAPEAQADYFSPAHLLRLRRLRLLRWRLLLELVAQLPARLDLRRARSARLSPGHPNIRQPAIKDLQRAPHPLLGPGRPYVRP